VQLEWHYSGVDIEVKFAPDGSVEAWAEDRGAASPSSGEPQ